MPCPYDARSECHHAIRLLTSRVCFCRGQKSIKEEALALLRSLPRAPRRAVESVLVRPHHCRHRQLLRECK
jgi:hypothetical protein